MKDPFARGTALVDAGRLDEAMACYDKVMNGLDPGDPQHIRALLRKGAILHMQDRYKEALACYEGVIRHPNPGDAVYCTALDNKGHILQEEKRYDEAIACFDEVIESFEPGDARRCPILCDKATALIHMAIDKGGGAGASAPHADPQITDLCGRALDCLDEVLYSATKDDPSYAIALVMRGEVLFDLNRHDEALAAMNEALPLMPDWSIYYRRAIGGKGQILEKLGRDEEATRCMMEFASIDITHGKEKIGSRHVNF